MAERRDVIRTRTTIQTAFFDLLFEKPREKITVRDVLRRCGFSNGTFYAHFRDIEALEAQLDRSILQRCRGIWKPNEPLRTEPCLETLEPYAAVLRAAPSPETLDGVRKVRALVFTALAERAGATSPAAIIAAKCLTGAMVDTCVAWLQGDGRLERSAFLRIVDGFLAHGDRI